LTLDDVFLPAGPYRRDLVAHTEGGSEHESARGVKRIGVLIDRLVVGGVEKTAIEEVRALREMGLDATLLVLKRDPVVPLAFRDRISGIPLEYLDDRIPKVLRAARRIPGFYFFSFFHLIYAIALPFRVAFREWDVILSHNSYTSLTAQMLWRTRHIPYCMFVWDPIGPILTKAYTAGLVRLLRPVLLPIGRGMDRLLAKGAHSLIVSSPSYVEYLVNATGGSKSIVVQPPGCFPASAIRKKVGNHLLSATSWKEGKQLETLLLAMTDVPDAKLVVAGRWLHDEYREGMLTLVSQLGLADRVRFEGEYDERGMAHLAEDALCMVTTNAELGFGMPALEAAAQACTFICPETSGVTGSFTNGIEAFYFTEGDSVELSKLLQQLVSEPDLAYRAGVAAWHRAQTSLTWRHHAETIALALGAVHAGRSVNGPGLP
jgi:glycosyltransferase involved in cell wall biosynthesis